MTYDICFDAASLFIMLVILFGTGRSYIESDLRHYRFRRLCIVLTAALCMDILSVVVVTYSASVPVKLNASVQAVFFLLLSATIYTYTRYVEAFTKENSLGRFFRVINLVVYGLYVILHIANIFGGFIFYFDEQLVYQKGNFYFVVITTPIYLYLYGLILLYINWKDLNKRQFYAAVLLMPIMFVGVVVDVLILPYHEITLFAMTFGVLIIFLYLETPDYQKLQATLEQLEQAKMEAERSSMAKTSFLAQMSHEIRTPINAVLGMNEMILRESGEENIQEYAGNAYNAGNALLSIINDILDISKIEAGKLEIVEAEYELCSLISDSYHMTVDRARKKGLDFLLECDENLPSKLWGDMFHIRQIIVNFLTNAVKYTDAGSVRLIISGKENEDGFVLMISVKDTGIGIDAQSMEKLFTSFERFDMKHNQTVEGTGLGLAICKQLAQLMGGSVRAESVYGQGSEFICTIPQKVTDRSPIGKVDVDNTARKVSAEKGLSFTAPDARILVVDDVEMNLVIFKGLLKGHGLIIDTALSGKKCLEMIQEQKYDIIFMDHMMPEMDGMETLARMRETEHLNKPTPVVMLTANAIAGEKEKYLSAGFASYLTKPVHRDRLEETLLKYLPQEKVGLRAEQTPQEDMTSRAAQALKEDMTSQTAQTPKENMTLQTPPEKIISLEKNTIKYGITSEEESMDNPLIDVNLGLSYNADSKDVYLEVLASYVKSGSEMLENIKKYCEDGKWDRYIIEVHALKGMSLTIGARKLSDDAKELELAGKNKDYELIKNKNSALLKLYERVLAEGEEYLKKHDADAENDEKNESNENNGSGENNENDKNNKKDKNNESSENNGNGEMIDIASIPKISYETFLDYIEKIKAACLEYDNSKVSAICDEAGRFLCGRTVLKPLFDSIKAFADDFECEEAAKRADEILSEMSER